MSSTPSIRLPTATDLPADLVALPRWVAWRWEERDGKRTKVPINPSTGRNASSTNPQTWGTFDEACTRAAGDELAGVGFMLGDGYAGVDLDKCRQPETGTIDGWAFTILGRLHSYAEISPSTTGLKLLVKATLPPGRRKTGKGHQHAVEMYDRARFFTVTGRRLDGMPATVEGRQAEVEHLHAELFPPVETPAPSPATGPHPLADDQLLDRIRDDRNGGKFARLFGAGDTAEYGGDHSAADLGLCSMLSFYSDDPAQIDRLFRRSALYRDKWERSDYREWTIGKALIRSEVWQGEAPRPGPTIGASAAVEASPDMPPASPCADQVQAALAELAETKRQLAAARERVAEQAGIILYQRGQLHDYRATIIAVREALANDQLGAERLAGIALAFEIAGTPEAYTRTAGVDKGTGEVLTEAVPLRDADGFTKIYLGHGSEDESGKPTRGVAAAMGASADTASRQLKKLHAAGVITLDVRKHRADDGNIRTTTWVRYQRPAEASAPTKVADYLAPLASAKAERTPQPGKQGDGRHGGLREPAICERCGSQHVRITCLDCGHQTVTTPTRHLAESGTRAPTSVEAVLNGPQDAESGPAAARRQAALRNIPVHKPAAVVGPPPRVPDDDGWADSLGMEGLSADPWPAVGGDD